ncbi:MAG: hypothetical protein FWD46_05190 [Cystobacterineae bacterium]|nr:hypothetical protein [Cystobacterineae bacterium]
MNLFLPEKQLEAWAAEEKVDLSEGQLIVPGEARGFPLVPAVYFARLESGEDEKNLVGCVKTMTQLDELEAEQLMDSALIGETAYRIQPGYIVTLDILPREKAEQTRPNQSSSEADLLAAFILDKL